MNKKIFITDYIRNPEIEQKIIGSAAQVHCLNSNDEKNFPEEIKDADGLLVWHTKISDFTLKKLNKCKTIIRYGVGYENIDLASVNKYGISFANNPDYGIDEVADTSCALVLNLIRKINLYNNQTRLKIDEFYKNKDKNKINDWQEEVIGLNKLTPIKRTSDHKLGIIGLGKIGTAVALRMKSFKMEIGFYDPYVARGYEKVLNIKRYETLKELASEATIISINAALNNETNKMINDQFIDSLNKDTILINTARGTIIDSLDVIVRGLKSNKLAAVGLDVLPQEPPSKKEILLDSWRNLENSLSDRIIINPHAGYYSSTSIIEMREKVAENMLLSLTGKKLRNIINY